MSFAAALRRLRERDDPAELQRMLAALQFDASGAEAAFELAESSKGKDKNKGKDKAGDTDDGQDAWTELTELLQETARNKLSSENSRIALEAALQALKQPKTLTGLSPARGKVLARVLKEVLEWGTPACLVQSQATSVVDLPEEAVSADPEELRVCKLCLDLLEAALESDSDEFLEDLRIQVLPRLCRCIRFPDWTVQRWVSSLLCDLVVLGDLQSKAGKAALTILRTELPRISQGLATATDYVFQCSLVEVCIRVINHSSSRVQALGRVLHAFGRGIDPDNHGEWANRLKECLETVGPRAGQTLLERARDFLGELNPRFNPHLFSARIRQASIKGGNADLNSLLAGGAWVHMSRELLTVSSMNGSELYDIRLDRLKGSKTAKDRVIRLFFRGDLDNSMTTTVAQLSQASALTSTSSSSSSSSSSLATPGHITLDFADAASLATFKTELEKRQGKNKKQDKGNKDKINDKSSEKHLEKENNDTLNTKPKTTQKDNTEEKSNNPKRKAPLELLPHPPAAKGTSSTTAPTNRVFTGANRKSSLVIANSSSANPERAHVSLDDLNVFQETPSTSQHPRKDRQDKGSEHSFIASTKRGISPADLSRLVAEVEAGPQHHNKSQSSRNVSKSVNDDTDKTVHETLVTAKKTSVVTSTPSAVPVPIQTPGRVIAAASSHTAVKTTTTTATTAASESAPASDTSLKVSKTTTVAATKKVVALASNVNPFQELDPESLSPLRDPKAQDKPQTATKAATSTSTADEQQQHRQDKNAVKKRGGGGRKQPVGKASDSSPATAAAAEDLTTSAAAAVRRRASKVSSASSSASSSSSSSSSATKSSAASSSTTTTTRKRPSRQAGSRAMARMRAAAARVVEDDSGSELADDDDDHKDHGDGDNDEDDQAVDKSRAVGKSHVHGVRRQKKTVQPSKERRRGTAQPKKNLRPSRDPFQTQPSGDEQDEEDEDEDEIEDVLSDDDPLGDPRDDAGDAQDGDGGDEADHDDDEDEDEDDTGKRRRGRGRPPGRGNTKAKTKTAQDKASATKKQQQQLKKQNAKADAQLKAHPDSSNISAHNQVTPRRRSSLRLLRKRSTASGDDDDEGDEKQEIARETQKSKPLTKIKRKDEAEEVPQQLPRNRRRRLADLQQTTGSSHEDNKNTNDANIDASSSEFSIPDSQPAAKKKQRRSRAAAMESVPPTPDEVGDPEGDDDGKASRVGRAKTARGDANKPGTSSTTATSASSVASADTAASATAAGSRPAKPQMALHGHPQFRQPQAKHYRSSAVDDFVQETGRCTPGLLSGKAALPGCPDFLSSGLASLVSGSAGHGVVAGGLGGPGGGVELQAAAVIWASPARGRHPSSLNNHRRADKKRGHLQNIPGDPGCHHPAAETPVRGGSASASSSTAPSSSSSSSSSLTSSTSSTSSASSNSASNLPSSSASSSAASGSTMLSSNTSSLSSSASSTSSAPSLQALRLALEQEHRRDQEQLQARAAARERVFEAMAAQLQGLVRVHTGSLREVAAAVRHLEEKLKVLDRMREAERARHTSASARLSSDIAQLTSRLMGLDGMPVNEDKENNLASANNNTGNNAKRTKTAHAGRLHDNNKENDGGNVSGEAEIERLLTRVTKQAVGQLDALQKTCREHTKKAQQANAALTRVLEGM